jgi:hypothetical protein
MQKNRPQQPLLDALDKAGPFSGNGLTPWRNEDGPDWTTDEEESVAHFLGEVGGAHWQYCDAKLKEWRRRTAAGDFSGRLEEWGEWVLTLADGTKVAVTYTPPGYSYMEGTADLEWHGDVSETGFRSDIGWLPPEFDSDLIPALIARAEQLRAETIREWEAARKPKPRAKAKGKRKGAKHA